MLSRFVSRAAVFVTAAALLVLAVPAAATAAEPAPATTGPAPASVTVDPSSFVGADTIGPLLVGAFFVVVGLVGLLVRRWTRPSDSRP